MTYAFLTLATLFFGGIAFGVLTTLWGKGMMEFAWFVVVAGLAVHFGIEAWSSVL